MPEYDDGSWLVLTKQKGASRIHHETHVAEHTARQQLAFLKEEFPGAKTAIFNTSRLLRLFNGDTEVWREMHPPFEPEMIKEIGANIGSYGLALEGISGADIAQLANTALTLLEQREQREDEDETTG